ncbi:DUF3857 domain-containing protein [Rhodanobacter sp. FW106-PBR-R2A-1-13]|uniref:DUF3857 domain-containing protein n=1 Tax=Rhodanobacter sp. FW106-PBR-R2A-1-13 TaxID=3454845 RepID=UPI0034E3BE5F
MTRILQLTVGLLAATFLPLAIAGPADPHIMVVMDRTSVQVTASGAMTVDRTEIMKALDASGARMLATLAIPFNASRQSVEVLGASVVMPDETMREVSREDIHTAPWPSSVPASAYADAKRTEIRFSGLQPGSVVSAHFVLHSTEPFLPGQVGYFQIVSRASAIQEMHVDVRAPAELRLNVRANDMRVRHGFAGSDETWVLTTDKVPPLINVATTSSLLAKSPFVAIGRTADAQEVGAAYLRRILPAERVTLELQQLADSIGEDSIDPEALMHRYYAWINAHIALVTVPLGLGNTAPRLAQDVLLSRYGTAEDRVILLQALMRAKALSSDLVFVPSLPVTWAGQLPVVPDYADRVLLTVHNGQHVLDIANPVLALGEFDPEDRGKFGFRVGPDGGVAPIQIPGQAEAHSNAAVASRLVMQADGSLDGTATIAAYGDMAATARHDAYANDPLALRARLAPHAPAGTNLSIVHTDDPMQPSDKFVINSTFTVPAYHAAGAYRMPVPRVVSGTRPMDAFADQQGPGLCQRTARSEDTEIKWVLPVVVDLPTNVDVDVGHGIGHYTATYIYDDANRTLHVQRSVRLFANPVECDPAQQAQFAKLADAVRADLAATLTVTPVATAAR